VLHRSETDADRFEVRPVFWLLAPAQLDTATDEVCAVETR